MAATVDPQAPPEGVFSLLDTDLYKLTMQCAVLKYFPRVDVTYGFNNRTPNMRLTRAAFGWLKKQINKLGNIFLSSEELTFLKRQCVYLEEAYLRYLSTFRFRPEEQLDISFAVLDDTGKETDVGDLHIAVRGLWVETILYEIPLLALTSEAYFKHCDRDWDHHGQEAKAYDKGCTLLKHGCIFSEFGTRRRRDYKTQDMVIKGLRRAGEDCSKHGWKGKLSGTSNVHLAMKYSIAPSGTVAHEWYMGIASITNDYENASEIALRYWLGCFGEGVLGIALTDTFGTPAFLRAFTKPIPAITTAKSGAAATLPSAAANGATSLTDTKPPLSHPIERDEVHDLQSKTYAEVFTGVRQDSGDPADYVTVVRDFYDMNGIKEKKTIVFSDSLNIDLCLEFKRISEESGFQPVFGVGTFFTNDYVHKSNGKKSAPLNIVIKLSSAGGRPAIKISDNIGKNTGDPEIVHDVKHRLGYVEKEWRNGDESTRWGKEGE